MEKSQYKTTDLEEALRKAEINFARKIPQGVSTPDEYYSSLPYILTDGITLDLNGGSTRYQNVFIKSPEYPVIGFMDAIAEHIGELYNFDVVRTQKLSNKQIQYFSTTATEPQSVVENIKKMQGANQEYLFSKKKHDKFVKGFLTK
jgi:hypothetical protein